MRENYEICITGRQTVDSETGEIEVNTLGDYSERNGIKYISYMEYDDDMPCAGHRKILKIEPDGTITMMRPGTSTRLVLQKGKRHKCMYETDVGLLTLGVFTQTLRHDLTDEGGEIYIRYTLDIDAHLSSKNEILFSLKRLDLLQDD